MGDGVVGDRTDELCEAGEAGESGPLVAVAGDAGDAGDAAVMVTGAAKSGADATPRLTDDSGRSTTLRETGEPVTTGLFSAATAAARAAAPVATEVLLPVTGWAYPPAISDRSAASLLLAPGGPLPVPPPPGYDMVGVGVAPVRERAGVSRAARAAQGPCVRFAR
jgi:hypothetical protein